MLLPSGLKTGLTSSIAFSVSRTGSPPSVSTMKSSGLRPAGVPSWTVRAKTTRFPSADSAGVSSVPGPEVIWRMPVPSARTSQIFDGPELPSV
jgi:hypothetical protein